MVTGLVSLRTKMCVQVIVALGLMSLGTLSSSSTSLPRTIAVSGFALWLYRIVSSLLFLTIILRGKLSGDSVVLPAD